MNNTHYEAVTNSIATGIPRTEHKRSIDISSVENLLGTVKYLIMQHSFTKENDNYCSRNICSNANDLKHIFNGIYLDSDKHFFLGDNLFLSSISYLSGEPTSINIIFNNGVLVEQPQITLIQILKDEVKIKFGAFKHSGDSAPTYTYSISVENCITLEQFENLVKIITLIF